VLKEEVLNPAKLLRKKATKGIEKETSGSDESQGKQTERSSRRPFCIANCSFLAALYIHVSVEVRD
jgi:hypothetical protein